MKIHAKEITTGNKQKDKIPFWNMAFIKFITFPFRVLFYLIGNKNDYTEVHNSNWTDLYPFPTVGHQIERKIVAETAFDGVVKFYKFRTENEKINSLFRERLFGEFHYETDYGIWLREFNSPNDWPKSNLVFIDTQEMMFRKIIESNSSWPEWNYEHVDGDNFNVVTEPANNYTTYISVKMSKI